MPYQCEYCDELMYKKSHYMCTELCKYCHSSPPCKTVSTMIKCSDCNRSFRGQFCFDRHKIVKYGDESVCENLQICPECCKFLNYLHRQGIAHECHEKICTICKSITTDDQHQCFIQKPQAVLLVYRKLFMREKTLGVVPQNNYHSRQNNRSFIADKWLLWQNKLNNGQLKFEMNLLSGKNTSTSLYVDGYDSQTNTVYEFLVKKIVFLIIYFF